MPYWSYFWMQNTLQYYERNYDRIQDSLSDIGGISSIILTIASILNLLIHNFIVILDTEELVLYSEQENYIKQRELSKKPTIYRKANKIMSPPRRSYQSKKMPYGNDQQYQSSNYQRFMKEGIEIYPNISSKEEKAEQYKNSFLKRDNNLFNNTFEFNKEGEGYYQGDDIQQFSNKFRGTGIQFYNREKYKLDIFNESKGTYSRKMKDDTIPDKKDESKSKPIEKQNFNWFKFIGYIICCGRNNKKIAYYEEFRAKLISEENIIQNYLDIYKLLKVSNIKKTDLCIKENFS